MFKTEYIIGAVLIVLWLKGSKKVGSVSQIEASVPKQGSNWGGDAWDRLNGTDLGVEGFPNLHFGAQADPGNIGRLSAQVQPQWNGSLL